MTYQEVLRKVYNGDFSTVPDRLLCLDPGETTGYAIFEKGYLKWYGQVDTIILDKTPGVKQGEKVIDWAELNEVFCDNPPTYVVCENYRIYAHKLERHSFSDVQTLRLIGGIDQLCHLGWHGYAGLDREATHDYEPPEQVSTFGYHQPVPIFYQMAVQAKGFATDDRLKDWGFWKEGMKHSRDAIRHGIYFLLISNRPKGGK